MPKKPGLAHHDHLRLGQVLAGIRDQVLEVRVTLLGAYPKTGPGAQPTGEALIALEALDRLREQMENRVFAEHPEHASTKVYSPLAEHRAQLTVPGLPGPRLRVVEP
ncbi:hypothetical protein AB0K43_31170 [Kitasatospora sp. NPDC049258]|uniref:hypothetical protein n=1 Tax=Kitasatospora sp. NPDC049258 TaxID=3155394 RepID=UPI00341A45C2